MYSTIIKCQGRQMKIIITLKGKIKNFKIAQNLYKIIFSGGRKTLEEQKKKLLNYKQKMIIFDKKSIDLEVAKRNQM